MPCCSEISGRNAQRLHPTLPATDCKGPMEPCVIPFEDQGNEPSSHMK